MILFKRAFLLYAVLFLSTAYGQQINKAKLDSLFNLLSEKNRAMGSVAISHDGHIIYTKSIGCANCIDNVQASENTKYRIGSITKMFTATIIFQLIEEGKLNLDTKLDQYYPNLINASKITISNLLNHHSGLYDFTRDSLYSQWNGSPKTHDEIIAYIASGPSQFEPGSKGEYSNSNFVILGYIIEKITAKNYKDVLKERITNKIGLQNTYVGDITDTKNNESYSYTYLNGWQQESITDMSIPGAAGDILSTPTELVKFIEALFAGKLIKQNSLDQMKTLNDGYGKGMFQFPFYDKKAYGHNGGIDGFASVLSYFPEDKLAVSYCSNGLVFPMNEILIDVLNCYYNKPFTLPVFKLLSLTSEDLDKYLGVYSTDIMPIKITVSKIKNTLIAQGTGQPSFSLEATEKDTFNFDQGGIVLVFNTEKGEMKLLQSEAEIVFLKDK
ncbi:MAG TPA: serine hydrolase domain-containing protein [Saprospiraceae bacterium]|nr:serine hydrolase domain-containing protein [Saprospiraceae bacterium]